MHCGLRLNDSSWPRDRPRSRAWIFFSVVALSGMLGGSLRAQSVDYARDAMLARNMVNVDFLGGRPASLAELLALVEIETGQRVTYPPGEIPLGAEVVVQSDGPLSLAALFTVVSAQQPVVFQVQDGQIVARAGSGKTPVAPAGLSSAPNRDVRGSLGPPRGDTMPAGGRSVADPADAEALAARLGDIAGKTSLSRARQEKQISAALREALTAATAGSVTSTDTLEIARTFARIAAAAVPEFVDTVADAAAFTPAVRRLPKGAAQVGAAAYEEIKS